MNTTATHTRHDWRDNALPTRCIRCNVALAGRSRNRAGDVRPGKGRHVALHLRGGEFAHASKSAGVRISQLSERYWSDRFTGARRVF